MVGSLRASKTRRARSEPGDETSARGAAQGSHPEIVGAGRALDAVEKGGEIDQFGARFHKAGVDDLFACHNRWTV